MIIDNINNIGNYQGLPIYNLLKYIANTNFSNIAEGKYYLNGDNLFYMVSSFTTKKYQDAIWETHYRYTDVHVILQGKETIATADVTQVKLQTEHKEKDLKVHSAPILNPYVLTPNMFAVFFTNNAHMPNLMVNNTPQTVKKIVFKVDLQNFNFKG